MSDVDYLDFLLPDDVPISDFAKLASPAIKPMNVEFVKNDKQTSTR